MWVIHEDGRITSFENVTNRPWNYTIQLMAIMKSKIQRNFVKLTNTIEYFSGSTKCYYPSLIEEI
jgi:hypothetical protein